MAAPEGASPGTGAEALLELTAELIDIPSPSRDEAAIVAHIEARRGRSGSPAGSGVEVRKGMSRGDPMRLVKSLIPLSLSASVFAWPAHAQPMAPVAPPVRRGPVEALLQGKGARQGGRRAMGSVIDRLGRDHRNMRVVLELLEESLGAHAWGEPADLELLGLIADYMLDYPDRVHHPLEELLHAAGVPVG